MPDSTNPTPASQTPRKHQPLRIFSYSLGFIFVTLIMTLVMGIRLDLTPYNPSITQWLNHTLQRQVTIKGDMALTLSFTPSFHFSEIRVANMDGYDEFPMAEINSVQARLSLLPLITGTLKIHSARLEGLQLNLLRDVEGNANWVLNSEPRKEKTETEKNVNDALLPFKLVVEEDIIAKDIQLFFQDNANGTVFDGSLDNMRLNNDNNLWSLQASGAAMGQPYQLHLNGNIDQIINNHPATLDLTGDFAGAELNAHVTFIPPRQGKSTISLSLNWDDAYPIKALSGLDLEPVAPLSLNTHIHIGNNTLSIDELQLASPVVAASGSLAINLGSHNTINGQLDLPFLDFSPWVQSASQPEPRAFAYSSPPVRSPLQQALDQWLVNTSTEVGISLDEIRGLGTDVHNISLMVKGENGLLSAPITADIASVPFRGEALIDGQQPVSTVSLSLSANHAPLGDMASWLSGIEDARGHLESGQLLLNTQGTKIKEWIKNSQLDFTLMDTQLNWGEQASWAIQKAKISAGMTRGTDINVSGELMSIPAQLNIKAGSLAQLLLKRNWNMQLDFSSPALNVTAKGALAPDQWINGSYFDLDVTSDNIHKLNPWLGIDSTGSGQLKLTGKLSTDGQQAQLQLSPMQLMDSSGQLSAHWRPDPEHRYLSIDGQFQQLNLFQIAQWLAPEPATIDNSQPIITTPEQQAGLQLDLPILSSTIVFADADINLGVNSITWANQTINAVNLSGQVRDGWLKQAPFSAQYAGGHFKGNLQLDLRDSLIKAGLNLAVTTPDIGQIMANFGVTDALDMTLDSANLKVKLQGHTLLELMDSASIKAELANGHWSLSDSYTGKQLPVSINSGHFVTGPDTLTTLNINGEVNHLPLSVTLDSVSLEQANDGREHLPVTLDIQLGDMTFNAESVVTLPIDRQQVKLAIHGFLPGLDHLNPLMKVDLPPYGPITLASTLSMNQQGYWLDDLLLKVNNSTLKGHGKIIPTPSSDKKTTIDLALTAPFIQLNDFAIDNWQAWLPSESAPDAIEVQDKNDTTGNPSPLLSPDSLALLNANFTLDVNEVRSGKDWLGAGQLHWQLDEGQLTLKPLTVMLPGGEIHFTGAIAAEGDQFDITLAGGAEQFDYGILARRIKPDTDMSGIVSLNIDVNSRSETPDSLLTNATGNFGFAVWPEQFEAGIIDLWAIGLVDAVMPTFNKDNQSMLNCAAGSFKMNHGQLQQKKVLLDTSRIQVAGEIEADFTSKTLTAYLTPRSKKAQIFSLQTPVQVTGEFDDFGLNIPLSAILQTSVRFTTSPVISPLRWLLETPLDKDGSQLCEQVLRESDKRTVL